MSAIFQLNALGVFPTSVSARCALPVATAQCSIFNFTGDAVNPYQPGSPHVASWTTFDLQLNFRPKLSGLFAGFQAALSAQNIFDRDPPFVLFEQQVPGLHYDPTNASVLGRFISLRLSKEFK